MWLSGFYGLAVYFPSFDSKLPPMAYSLTFNLLALLCTLPREGGLHVVYCQFLFTFQVCTTRFNNKNNFLDILSVLWKMSEPLEWLRSGQEVGLLRHCHVRGSAPVCCPHLPPCRGSSGDRIQCTWEPSLCEQKQAQLFWIKSISVGAQVF